MELLILSCLEGFALGLTDIGDCGVTFATEDRGCYKITSLTMAIFRSCSSDY